MLKNYTRQLFAQLSRHLPRRLVQRDPLPDARHLASGPIPESLGQHCLNVAAMDDQEIWRAFDSHPEGLNEGEVAAKILKHGDNQIPAQKPSPWWVHLWTCYRNPFNLLLTVLGIVMKVFQIIISITIGMAAGCIPIVGYNYGAQQLRRCRGVLWRLMGAEFLLGVLALLITQLFPRQIIGLFGSESELYNEFAVMTFRVYLCMLPLATVNKAAFIFMQAMGRPVESAGLSFFREVLLAVPLVMLLPRAFGLMGVLYSMPVADILTFFASCFVLLRTDRQLRK